MLLEYLFLDKSKRSLVETFNNDLRIHWSKGKEDDLPFDVTYKDFDEADYWIVRYEKSGNNESVAKQFSEINERVCDEFSPTVLTDGSSEYFNKILYPLVNEFERSLRKLLYLKVSLCNDEKLKSAIRDIEKKDFGDIYNILFVDNDFRSAAREKIKKLNTRSEMFEAIDSLSERTAWDILIGTSALLVIKDNFDLLKEYRNDVMHAHNIGQSKFKAAKQLFSKANSQLDQQISEILQYPSTTMVSPTVVDTLYDKLVAFSNGAEKITNNMSRVLDLFAELSTASISQEGLTNLTKFVTLWGMSTEAEKNECPSPEVPSVSSEETPDSNEEDMSSHE
jgi:hypothetical protein